jgi:hypothetical protein
MSINWPPRSALIGSYRRIPARLALAAGFCLAAPALLQSPAMAQPAKITDGYRLDLNKTINGASPAGPGPWGSLEIKNIDNGVSILFEPNLAAGEFITKAGISLTQEFQDLNSDPFAGLSVTCDDLTAGANICSNYDYVAQVNGYDIEGAAVGGFDLGFNFTGTGVNGGSGRLTNGKTVQFNLLGTALTAADLLGTINVKGLDVNAAAKVQGIRNGGSGVVADPDPVPVPGPLPLLGIAAAFQTSRRLRSRLAAARLGTGTPLALCPVSCAQRS